MSNESLKRLSVVPEVTTKGCEAATNMYNTAKTYVPEQLKEPVEKIEEKLSSLSAPLVAQAQDKGSEILKAVDLKVDELVLNANTVYEKNTSYINQQIEYGREYHAKNMEAFKVAREQYLTKVTESVEYLKQNGLVGAARKAADEVVVAVSEARKLPGAVVKQVQKAYEHLMSFNAVEKIMENSRPAVDAAYARYEALHNSVVSSSYYKKAFSAAEAAVSRTQATMLYQKAKENIWTPYLSKYADPALGQLTAHPYYNSFVAQITPKA